jgi:hypothetical protein
MQNNVAQLLLDFGYYSGVYLLMLLAMIQKVNAPVAVYLKSDPHKHEAYPAKIQWAGRDYITRKITWHQPRWIGRVLYHEYYALTDSLLFRLQQNTQTLQWVLLEITDDES